MSDDPPRGSEEPPICSDVGGKELPLAYRTTLPPRVAFHAAHRTKILGGITVDKNLMQQIVDEDVIYYLDSDNKTSVYVEFKDSNGAYRFEPFGSTYFLANLGYTYRLETGEKVNPDFSGLLEIKRQDTIVEMQNLVSINHRIAGSMNDKIAYFLADDKRRTILVTSEGWKRMLKTEEKFIQREADMAQVKPKRGGDILALLRPYINLSNDDFRLLVIWLIQAYSRQSSHYALVISSSRGTGKSTLTKLLRSLIDPSYSDASLTPSSDSDLKNLLANTVMACFDNTAALSEDYSNILCAAITGAKEAKRKLYTDCDQIILNLHNIVILNGIDILPKKSDLIERSLLFELKKIPNDKRKTDYEFWSNFEADKPAILGAVFDTLQKAMQILPDLKVTGLARMADAHKEMLAIALALDIPQDEFQRIFSANQGRLNTSYMQNDPFIRAVVNYVERNKHIDKSATAVYEELSKSIVGKCKNFPGDVSALSKRLNEEKDTLLDLGIHFHRRMRSSYSYITLDKIAPSKLTKKQKERQAQWAAQFSDEDASPEE